ncbi:hypothetical protein M405DRAFT_858773 [Rhizopogon salebrosus TDB-379]|nr:hypothetical protein M405DRAFT_858773 [Rhizopogon salebrosus TDB-379]
MAIAPYAALVLQWGTVGAALIVAYFTPTTENRVPINELPHIWTIVDFDLDVAPYVQYPRALLRGLFPSNV